MLRSLSIAIVGIVMGLGLGISAAAEAVIYFGTTTVYETTAFPSVSDLQFERNPLHAENAQYVDSQVSSDEAALEGDSEQAQQNRELLAGVLSESGQVSGPVDYIFVDPRNTAFVPGYPDIVVLQTNRNEAQDPWVPGRLRLVAHMTAGGIVGFGLFWFGVVLTFFWKPAGHRKSDDESGSADSK